MQTRLQKQTWLRVILLVALAGVLSVEQSQAISKTYAKQTLETISGVITNEIGETMAGVNVFDKTTRKGTVTDAKGKYSISAKEGTTLVFSFVGYTSKEIIVGNSSVINKRN